MTTSVRDLNALVAGEERVFALLEPGGALELHWGASKPAVEEALSYRKFHYPRAKQPSPWRDFGNSASLSLSESRRMRHSEIKETPAPERPSSSPESSREDWDELCARAEEAIRTERAHKLVPAREARFELLPREYRAILAGLAGRLFHPRMENAYRFLIKSRGSVFFGATPELLFKREGDRLDIPAIAGTRALSPGVPESSLRDELMASDKDRAEHAWVVEGICEALKNLGLKPKRAAAPVVLKVPRLLHLYTPITAEETKGLTAEKIIEALHPTPAIGGHPRSVARDLLFEAETFDRGLFSAPLLFQAPGRERCLVAIRSALLTQERLHFFAGAGYVHGSTAESEWQETERKLQVMQTLLFGETHDRP